MGSAVYLVQAEIKSTVSEASFQRLNYLWGLTCLFAVYGCSHQSYDRLAVLISPSRLSGIFCLGYYQIQWTQYGVLQVERALMSQTI